MRKVNIRREHKLADRWERTVHVVVKRINEGPVYTVKPERGSGPHRTLHRDLLLPCGFLPVDVAPEGVTETHSSRRKKLRSQRSSGQPISHSDQDEDGSDEEERYDLDRVVVVETRLPILHFAENEAVRLPLTILNPQAAEFTLQPFRVAEQQYESSVNVPQSSVVVEDFSDNCPVASSDDVVIDIPEIFSPFCPPGHTQESVESAYSKSCDVQLQQPQCVTLSEGGQSEPGGSVTERSPPHKLTDDKLGKL